MPYLQQAHPVLDGGLLEAQPPEDGPKDERRRDVHGAPHQVGGLVPRDLHHRKPEFGRRQPVPASKRVRSSLSSSNFEKKLPTWRVRAAVLRPPVRSCYLFYPARRNSTLPTHVVPSPHSLISPPFHTCRHDLSSSSRNCVLHPLPCLPTACFGRLMVRCSFAPSPPSSLLSAVAFSCFPCHSTKPFWSLATRCRLAASRSVVL